LLLNVFPNKTINYDLIKSKKSNCYKDQPICFLATKTSNPTQTKIDNHKVEQKFIDTTSERSLISPIRSELKSFPKQEEMNQFLTNFKNPVKNSPSPGI
jgi:hypothetical protein